MWRSIVTTMLEGSISAIKAFRGCMHWRRLDMDEVIFLGQIGRTASSAVRRG